MDSLADLAERTVHGLLKQRAAERPNDPFLRFEDREFTFGALHEAASRVAGGLAALGVGRGDKVAIMMGNRPEFLICWFALSQLGAVEVPINTAHRGTLLHYMLDQAECSLLILEGTFQDRLADIAADLPGLGTVALLDGSGLEEIPQRIVDFRTLENAAPLAAPPVIGPADPVAVMFTSGTTGPSKGAVLPQNYVLMQAAIIAEGCRYTPEDCLYNALPLFHGNAQFLSTIPALLSGARMVLAPRFSASAFWDDVRANKCTAFNYIGGILPILWKAPPAPDDAESGLRLMMGAGAPKDLFEPFEQRFGVRLVEGYGMSEIGIPLGNRHLVVPDDTPVGVGARNGAFGTHPEAVKLGGAERAEAGGAPDVETFGEQDEDLLVPRRSCRFEDAVDQEDAVRRLVCEREQVSGGGGGEVYDVVGGWAICGGERGANVYA